MNACLAALYLCAAGPAVEYRADAGRFEARGLPAGATLAVRVRGADTALLGTAGAADGVLWFRPRFPLAPGVTYTAAASAGGKVLATAEVTPPRPAAGPPAELARVSPEAGELPENLLKFYLHFSAPVKRGEAYRRVRLLDAGGTPIDLPFLELDEELWDPSGTRLTLFLDPGRIKRGLKPREDVGPVIEEGKAYTLEVDAGWPDVHGRPLKAGVRKPFKVTAADAGRPDPAGWKLTPPARPGDALEVRFGEPLDRALAERVLTVEGPAGPVAGRVELADADSVWRLRPQTAWRPGEYRLVVGGELEDLAGNRPGRLFDATPEDAADAPTLRRPFRVQ